MAKFKQSLDFNLPELTHDETENLIMLIYTFLIKLLFKASHKVNTSLKLFHW